MEKIDRLGWADGFAFSVYGLKLGVRVTDPHLLPLVEVSLPFGWRRLSSPIVDRLYSLVTGHGSSRKGVRRLNLLYADSLRLARSESVEAVLEALEADCRMHVAEHARRRVFVHAGVVGFKDLAIVIPGATLSGKSTLVAEFVRAGALYFSDEFAVLDSQGRVHPFLKPIALRETKTSPQTRRSVESLGGLPAEIPLPVGLVLATRYSPEARTRLRRLSPGHGTLALLAHTVTARRRPEKTVAMLRRIALQAPVLEGPRGEARELVERVLSRI